MTEIVEGYEDAMPCPICLGGEAQANCGACAGRGVILSIPYCERKWDEIVTNLWLGGHDSQEGYCYLDDTDFDVVFSMVRAPGTDFAPPEGVVTYTLPIRDEDKRIDAVMAHRLNEVARTVKRHLDQGERVLVRCWGGLNRASLIVGLVLIKQGMTPEEAITLIRAKRSPYALFNQAFVAHLRSLA